MSAFIDEHRERFGVEPICETLGVSASAYYQRATGERSARAVEDERLLGVIEALHVVNYCAYGSRRMWKALLREGEQVGRSRVERLMRQNAIQGAKRRGKPWRTTKADPAALRSPDRVQRDFTASRPDEKWFADFTYLRCWEGLVFFSFVIDAYSRMIVGWQFAGHMRTDLVLDALRMALRRRAPGADVSLVAHSDAGSQAIHVVRLHPAPGRPRCTRFDRDGRGRLRQRSRRELRRHLQDRAHHGPHLGQQKPAQARHRGVRRLVQQHPPARIPQRPATPRDRGTIRCEKPGNHTHAMNIGNLQKRSPWNPGRLTSRPSRAHRFASGSRLAVGPSWSMRGREPCASPCPMAAGTA